MKLHPYQEHAVAQMVAKHHLMLSLEMGLGKTAITLAGISKLFDLWDVGKVLIVAPKRVVENVWVQEIEKWGFDLTATRIQGTPVKRLRALDENTNIHLINYDNLTWLLRQKSRPHYDMYVFDESHMLKSVSSQRFKSLRSLIKHKGLPYRTLLLTGTPMPNSLQDLWSQFYLIDQGERLYPTITQFRDRWFTRDYTGFNYIPTSVAVEQVAERLEDVMISMRSEDYLTLPDKMVSVQSYLMPSNAEAVYKEAKKELILGDELVANAAVLTTKLLQVCNGWYYTDEHETVHLHNGKLDLLAEVLEGISDNVLLAVSFKADVALIRKRFDCTLISDDGAIDKWNRGEIPLMLANPASAGTGLNLQAGGHTIVWYSPTWNLGHYQQFNARLHRQGQPHPVMIHHLTAQGTVEDRVLDVLTGKATTQDALKELLSE